MTYAPAVRRGLFLPGTVKVALNDSIKAASDSGYFLSGTTGICGFCRAAVLTDKKLPERGRVWKRI
jgi:hypothetical protein